MASARASRAGAARARGGGLPTPRSGPSPAQSLSRPSPSLRSAARGAPPRPARLRGGGGGGGEGGARPRTCGPRRARATVARARRRARTNERAHKHACATRTPRRAPDITPPSQIALPQTLISLNPMCVARAAEQRRWDVGAGRSRSRDECARARVRRVGRGPRASRARGARGRDEPAAEASLEVCRRGSDRGERKKAKSASRAVSLVPGGAGHDHRDGTRGGACAAGCCALCACARQPHTRPPPGRMPMPPLRRPSAASSARPSPHDAQSSTRGARERPTCHPCAARGAPGRGGREGLRAPPCPPAQSARARARGPARRREPRAPAKRVCATQTQRARI